MATFADLQTHFDDLIRKGLEGSVFVKRSAPADAEIQKLKDATGLLAIPPGYVDVGRITKSDGVTWSRDVDTADVESLGAQSPTRRDIVSDVAGLSFTMQESKRAVFELHEGLDLSAVKQDAHGNVTWDRPDRSATVHYRVFVLFKDGDGADAIYFAKWLPRAIVTDRGEQKYGPEDEIQYPVSLTGLVDSTAGTAMRSMWAGPADVLTKMGFAVGP